MNQETAYQTHPGIIKVNCNNELNTSRFSHSLAGGAKCSIDNSWSGLLCQTN